VCCATLHVRVTASGSSTLHKWLELVCRTSSTPNWCLPLCPSTLGQGLVLQASGGWSRVLLPTQTPHVCHALPTKWCFWQPLGIFNTRTFCGMQCLKLALQCPARH